ncbi:hypothetical protein DFJ77DRAFT_471307 [Powellomyces hirtus]|nr:hypothetical protein DFJ77DRAFT_471307 [Powellomyces hirtus]
MTNASMEREKAKKHSAPEPAERLYTLLDKFLSAHPEPEVASDKNESTRSISKGKLALQRDLARRNAIRQGRQLRVESDMGPTEQFLIHLASALYAYGTPSHSLWYHMQQVAKGLGHQAEFSCFPTYMLVAFRHRDEPAAHPLFFQATSGQDMYKLQLVDELARRVASYGQAPPGGLQKRAHFSDADLEDLRSETRFRRPGLLRAATMGSVSSFTDTTFTGKKRGSSGNQDGGRFSRIKQALTRKRGSHPDDVRNALSTSSDEKTSDDESDSDSESDLKQWILDLASYGQGFFEGGFKSKSDKDKKSCRKDDRSSDSDSDTESSSSKPLLPKRRSKEKEPIKEPEAPFVPDDNAPSKVKLPPAPSITSMQDAFELIAVEDATRRLKQIVSLPDYYPDWFQYILAGFASGGGAGLFFGGGWWDVLVATILGAIIGMMGGLCEGQRTLDKVYEFIGAVLVSFTVRTLIHLGLPLCYSPTILSSSMFLLQGVTITLALVELATRHMISGTARLAYGITMTGLIGYGLDLGANISAGIFHISKIPETSTEVCPNELSLYFKLALFLPTSLALSMSISAHPVQIPGMTVVSAIGYATYTWASGTFSENLASAIGSFAVGVSSNIHARWSGSPAIVNDLGGLGMLFPGGLAVRGIMKIMEGDDVVDGLGLSTGVLVVGLSLGVGMFMAGVVAPLPSMRMLGGSKRGKRGPILENLHF